MIDDCILNRLVERLASALAPPTASFVDFVVDGVRVGALTPARARRLREFGDVFAPSGHALTFAAALTDPARRTTAVDRVVRTLAAEGALTAWRDEAYPVAATFAAPPLFLLERAAARYFGIATYAVHVNGVTLSSDGRETMWLARRSSTKSIDPGLLDNAIAGGIAAGADVTGTLAKEAWEEAGVPCELALSAVPAGSVRIRRLQPDGLQDETIFVHDLVLPYDFVPLNQDGEVAAFRLAAPEEVARLAGNSYGPDVVTADAALVMSDWLLRRGYAPGASVAWRRLDALCRATA